MYSYRLNSPKNLAKYSGNTSSKIFSPVFARVRIQAPHVFAQKIIPQEFFPACIGFVPWGIVTVFPGKSNETIEFIGTVCDGAGPV